MDLDGNGGTTEGSSTGTRRGWRKARKQEDTVYYGLGSCRPQFLQCCTSMAAFTAIYSLAGLVTTALQIYITSQVTTLERHFGFSSSISGFLVSSNDIGFLSTIIIMSYLTRKIHIPRGLALSTMFYGIAGLVCTIPYFLTKDQLNPPGNASSHSAFMGGQTCQKTEIIVANNSLVCVEQPGFSYIQDQSTRKMAIAVIAVGMIVQGICKSPRVSFTATYVDDNVPKTKTGIYLGIITGIVVCASALAYGIGGVFSKMFVTLQATELTPVHPRWLGAWWLGFVMFGGLSILSAVPLVFFPRHMTTRQDSRILEKNRTRTPGKKCDVRGLLKGLWRLVTNPVYLPIVVGNCITTLTVAGLMAFLPKYMETQFTLTAWKANMILGLLNIVTNCAGTIIGGAVTTKMKLTPLGCLKLAVGMSIAATLISVSGVFFGCPNPEINMGHTALRGISEERYTYSPKTDNVTVTSECRIGCYCDDKKYFPVCGSDGKNYFSPCHAGCSSTLTMSKLFTNCTCVGGSEKTATPGLCDADCKFLYAFATVSVIGGFIITAGIMPQFIATIRSVSEVDKPLALGLNGFLTTLLGWLPGPIFFGWLIDGVCKVWASGCAGKGACAMYDIVNFRYRYHGVSTGSRAVSTVLLIFSLFMAKRKNSPYHKYRPASKDKLDIDYVAKTDQELKGLVT